MDLIHAKYVSFVVAGGNLGTAAQFSLAKERLMLKSAGVVQGNFAMDNPNPVDRAEVGTTFEARGVLLAATQAELVTILGGNETSNVFTKTQGVRVLGNYDFRVGVVRRSDGLIVMKDLTNVNFMPEIEEGYESEKQFYLPFVVKSTSTTTYTSDNSAV